jgi:flagellar hook-associated protein 1 FlgK
MADALSIGLSALIAQQRALATTSNNIANASTPGYSRQRTEFVSNTSERLGNESVGTGVKIDTTRRLSDDILAEQVRSAAGSYQRADAFNNLAESIDDLLADSDTGLAATLQDFANSLQSVANDPSSTSSREAFLSQARSLIARFDSMDQRLSEVGDEVRTRMGAATDEITSIGKSLADVNRQIVAAGASADRATPPELLDQRDRLLERLSELVQVNTAQQPDGTTSVFIGSGQVLVLGANAATVQVTPGTTDPTQPQIVLHGIGPDINITPFVTGGQLGGTIDFNREMLAPARSELGRIAVGLVTSFNAVHRNGMDAEGELGGDFFSIGQPQAFAANSNSGTASVALTFGNVADLESTNYRLSYDGANYTLVRADNGAVVPTTGTGAAGNPLIANGLSIVISGAPAAGDQFLLKPLEDLGGALGLVVTRPADVAAAAPTRTAAALANTGGATISAGRVFDVTNANLLSTATIQFLTPTTYSIDGAGNFAYTPGGDIDVNGTRVQISGAPAVGDQFTIGSNVGGSGDNRNAQALIARLGQSVFDGNVTLQNAAADLVTNVGARTAEAANQRDVQQFVFEKNRDRLDSARGVNLDEEAANMLRYEQLYQAAAQTMSVAGNLFNTLLLALQR